MRRYIEIKNPGARQELASMFKVSSGYVSMSLNFKRDGCTARKIREMALKKGGKEMVQPDAVPVDNPQRVTKVLDAKGKVMKTI